MICRRIFPLGNSLGQFYFCLKPKERRGGFGFKSSLFFTPNHGKWSNVTSIFSNRLKAPTSRRLIGCNWWMNCPLLPKPIPKKFSMTTSTQQIAWMCLGQQQNSIFHWFSKGSFSQMIASRPHGYFWWFTILAGAKGRERFGAGSI